MALCTDWSPLSDFSLLGIFAMLVTLLIIDVTKQTIPGYTFLLLFFNYYAIKVALEVAADKYPKVKAKVSRFDSSLPPFPDQLSLATSLVFDILVDRLLCSIRQTLLW